MLRTVTFTLLALVAFASNSLLTRSALGTGAIDAASFTAIRLLASSVDQPLAHEEPEGHRQQDDHDRTPDELGQGELPSQQ